MISRDPKCVFVGNNAAESTVLANWLEHQGISTQVMDTLTHGGLAGLTAWTGTSNRGIEVWVVSPEDAAKARDLIAENEEIVSASAPPDDETTVLAFCEECGRSSEFPGNCRGTIQDCPHCGRYMDVVEDDTDRPAANQLPSYGRASDSGASGVVATLQRLQKPIIFLIVGGMAFYVFMLVASGIAVALGL